MVDFRRECRIVDGIVSRLDPLHSELVENLWAELESQFGLRGLYPARFPHFSYHVVDAYDDRLLLPILERFAGQHRPFHVHTTGLGIFTGAQPVVYIPVVRSPELAVFHQELWWAVSGASRGSINLYHPNLLMPHVTLAHGDTDNNLLPELIRYLCGRSFTWDIPIDNLVLVRQAGTGEEEQIVFKLGTCPQAECPEPDVEDL